MDNTIKSITFFSLFVFTILSTMTSFLFISAIGMALFLFFSLKFFFGLGKTFEIRDLMISVALLQWIAGPLLKYHLSPVDINYYMAVPEKVYMSYALPASAFFIIALYFPGIYKKIDSEHHLKSIKELLVKYPNIDMILISIGVVAGIAVNFSPVSIKFFIYLIGCSRFTGLFFLVLSKRKFKWHIFGAIIFWLFLETVRDAVFHELLLWLTLFFIVISFLYKFGTKQKLMFIIPLFVFMTIIQSVKFYFRQEINNVTSTLGRAGIFTQIFTSELSTGEKTMSSSNFDAAVDRINQGWIVARIMRYTPNYEPFANGETIITGIKASLLPRFLNPDKAKAGGRDNFERFTGRTLSENTSMGLSPLGEAYANFGLGGGILFMFVLGLLYNGYIYMIIKLTDKVPSLILWLPLLFLQVIKAETDFVVVLNHIVKASMVVSLLIFFIRGLFRTKI